jgi:hypothetical protein
MRALGPDGAGKSALTEIQLISLSVRSVYMGLDEGRTRIVGREPENSGLWLARRGLEISDAAKPDALSGSAIPSDIGADGSLQSLI